jgi:acetyl-CoA carboxylase alpha subunit
MRSSLSLLVGPISTIVGPRTRSPAALARHLRELCHIPVQQLLEGRAARFRALGIFEELREP